MNKDKTPLELYVHIPFCVKKCDYCDFLSGSSDLNTQKKYVQALLAEICGTEGFSGREITTVFIGGGTPSVLEASDIYRILDTLRDKFCFAENVEITMEANPGTLTREKLAVYRDAGINRLSLGLQSAQEQELRALGRIHTFTEFLENYRLCRKAGFTNINVDLMFAIPGQTREGWAYNLRTVAELEPEHISAYSLIVEDGTPFAKMELDLPDEDTEYQMYEDTAQILQEYGYAQYEISNYARPGYECRHNIGYWNRTDYLGLGLGAASLISAEAGIGLRITGETVQGSDSDEDRERSCRKPGQYRFTNTRDMKEYIKYSSDPAKIRKAAEVLSVKEMQEEFMFLGFRMTEGVSEKVFQDQFGISLDKVYGDVLNKYKNMNFLEKENGFWRFTRTGIHVSNQILADFLQD